MKYLFMIALCLMAASGLAQGKPLKHISERDGKIGIGTRTPDELLTVKGKIHTQEVLVDLNGAVAPDYVFEHYFMGRSDLEPAYQMPTLSELSSYLQQNRHLPGIPSAQQLSREGMNLKEMNLKLLEKIEELTLYTIQQQEAIEELREEVRLLKNE